jgi:hypothetical protein
VVDYFQQHYGKRLITVSATRTTTDQDENFKKLVTQNQMREGFQIQHIMAADKNKCNISLAEEVITDANLLAKSDVFIHITSNIATAVSFMNPATRMIYCE